MKTFNLENEPKITTGFTVPENYFEDFSAKMMQNLPEQRTKTISIFSKKTKWFTATAAILILSLSLPIYNHYYSHSAEVDQATLENYISYHSTISNTDIVDLLDEQDIQKLSIDLDIDDALIENELSSNKNLEQYIISQNSIN